MAYSVNKYNGELLIVLEDGTIDTSTSLGLVGRNYVGYGETQNENFIHLLENFANDKAPTRPLKGQIWYNTNENSAYIYDGAAWSLIGSATTSDNAPESPNLGTLWLKTPIMVLYIFNGLDWAVIGPEAVDGYGITRFRSGVLEDSGGVEHPVIFLTVNDTIMAVCTSTAFVVNPNKSVPLLSNNLIPGINFAAPYKINGDITGTAETANRLTNARLINGVAFDGQQNINIKASTTNRLIKGSYLTGGNFDGSQEVTLGVDASSANIIGKVVARNSAGGFAAGTITADLVGNVTGEITSTGTSSFNIITANQFVGQTLTGNAFSASQLQIGRKINGILFDGTKDINVPAPADTLLGDTINPDVKNSSLTQVGTLTSLLVADDGISVGSGNQVRILVDSAVPTIRSNSGQLNFDLGNLGPDISFVNSTISSGLGGPNAPAILGDNTTNLGINGYKFNSVYANNFFGNATTATSATTSTNLSGGGAGSIPYQTAAGTTTFLNIGSDGFVLRARPGNTIQWEALSFEQLNSGTYINFVNTTTSSPVLSYNSSIPVTVSVDATSANTASKVVARDASGNFSAGTITANLTGNVTGSVTGNAGTATRLQTPRTINGVAFDGTANIAISAADPTKVSKAGDSMSGYLTLNGNPIDLLHATPKQYVDSRLPQYTIISGASASISGFTNQVGSWNFGANFFDVFPPAGKSMGNLIAFIPSINQIHFAGGVDGNDSLVCTYSYLGDRIRVYVQNTEQRSTPAANYLVIWS